MPMLEENTNAEISSAPLEAGSEQKQRRQMLIALALLLIALILVLVKDRQFWFPAATAVESEPVDETTPEAVEQPQPPTPNGQPTASPRPKPKQHAAATVASPPSAAAALSPVITNRAVLPPLEVEVVAGDQRRTIRPGNTSVRLDLQQGQAPTPAAEAVTSAGTGSDGNGVATSASERVRISPSAASVVSHPVEPSYPLLAKQMKVQGSVVLQALIGKDGNIQDLQVLSGPAILSSAAREAVKQWRFKPYYQAGLPVETEARITVNFTISTQ